MDPSIDAPVQITTDGDPDELASLLNWLEAEDEFRGRVELQRTPARPGEMGAVVQALTVAIGSGGLGVPLARSLSTWLKTRRREVHIEIAGKDGSKIKLDAKSMKDVAEVIPLIDSLQHPKGKGK